jgi:hypothetical protein
MLNGLKNVFLTALMVLGATMATAGAAALVATLFSIRGASSEHVNTVLYAGPAVFMMAAFAGAFFSVVSLAVVAVTMPPAIGLIRLLRLPRPLFDIFGGSAAGFLCAQAAVEMLDSLARSKGGDWGGEEMQVLLEICALVGGGALGYLRHAVLVKKHEEPPLPQFA